MVVAEGTAQPTPVSPRGVLTSTGIPKVAWYYDAVVGECVQSILSPTNTMVPTPLQDKHSPGVVSTPVERQRQEQQLDLGETLR